MEIQFATSDTRRAAKRIRAAYPSRDLSDEQLDPLLGLVRDGIIRVQDPKMHGQVGIIPGDKWDGDTEAVREAAKALDPQEEADDGG